MFKENQQISLTDLEMLRYSRQILLDGWDIEAQTYLKNSQVIIIGMGGLGCPVAETLVRAGVGHLHIIDMDIIDESNLQRQTLFIPSDIQQAKVTTAKHRLQTINEFCQISAYQQPLTTENYPEFLQKINHYQSQNQLNKIDLILDCTDNFKTRDVINQISVSYQIPLLSASAIAQEGQLALFEPTLNTGCYHCLFQDDVIEDERRCINSGVLASTTAIIGNLQAQIALTYLGLKQNPIRQTLVLWNGLIFNLKKIHYQADPTCKVCQKNT